MKNLFLAITIVISGVGFLPLQAQKKLNPVITLQIPEGDGSNSAAVAWNPLTKKYYTSMAGNAIYPMAVYDVKGKTIQDDVIADNDLRGIWFNPISKKIEFNCYDSGGIGHLELDVKGKIDNKQIDIEGMNQPDAQCVGVYYTAGNFIIYFNSNTYSVEKYNPKTGKLVGTLSTLHVGCKTKSEMEEMDADTEITRWDARNKSVVHYTGIPKSELAILNIDDHTIELYDQKTGLLTKTAYNIPDEIPLYAMFNFSYNNGIWWFFNKEERKWVGCK